MAIDIMQAFQEEPPELDFVLPGFLAGTIGALIAPGATGKSYWALQAAMAIACSVTGGDTLDLRPQHTGRVVYLAGEDPAPALIRRVHAVGQHLNIGAREAIAENLTLEPVMGSRINIMDDQHLGRIIQFCSESRLIVLDTLSRIHRLDENSNGDMARLLSALEHLAAQTGAAVMFLHHTSKVASFTGQTDHQHASRGASVLTDNARWSGALVKMTEDEAETWGVDPDMRGYFIRFSIPKNNYGEPIPERWYRRTEGGALIPAKLERQRRQEHQERKGKARGEA